MAWTKNIEKSGPAMTTWQLIRGMVQRNFELQCGLHNGRRGYWACFIPINPDTRPTCDECSEPWTMEWKNSGHSMTLHRAIVMAAKLARKEIVIIPSMEAFA